MNFIEAYKEGQEGKNIGLPTGLSKLDKAIDGIQRRAIYGIAAAPKVGKTTFVDFCFVINPAIAYLDYVSKNPDTKLKVKWFYYSFEIDRVRKEFKYASYFFYHDYNIATFIHNDRVYQISPRYLLGRLTDHNDKLIPVKPEHETILQEIYERRIIPLFGEYSASGRRIRAGLITFIENRNNPTGLRNDMIHYAKENGEFIEESYQTKEVIAGSEKTITRKRIIGYKPNNPELFTIVVTDHMRKLVKERGFTTKENIDKWVEYQVELRNWCKFTFVDIIHLNRAVASVERLKYMKEYLYPTGDDVKDTGNLSEEADYLITLFNPKDEKYNLDTHFGITLADYPNYRSVHLVESRDTECPLHTATQMYGNINVFKQI